MTNMKTANKRHKIDNPDIIALALYELGGAGQFVDVEDIFVRCYEISPERFGWRKHRIPNYKNLYHALRHFEAGHPRILIRTPDGLERQLSAEGVEWVRERLPLYKEFLRRPNISPPTRRRVQRVLNELSNHRLTREFMLGERGKLPKHDVADLLLCSPDSPPSVWNERLETYRSAATDSNRPELVQFLDYIRAQQPEWFAVR